METLIWIIIIIVAITFWQRVITGIVGAFIFGFIGSFFGIIGTNIGILVGFFIGISTQKNTQKEEKTSFTERIVAKKKRICPKCHGIKSVPCFSCGGTGHGSAFDNTPFCRQCNGKCHVVCNSCKGSGIA